MLTLAAAIALIVALALDVSHAGQVSVAAGVFAVAGVALLGLSVIFPSRRRRAPAAGEDTDDETEAP